MHLTDESYGIEPLDSAPDQHLLYLLRDVTSQPQGCGTRHERSNVTEHAQPKPTEVHHGEHRRVRSFTHKHAVTLFGCHRESYGAVHQGNTFLTFHGSPLAGYHLNLVGALSATV